MNRTRLEGQIAVLEKALAAKSQALQALQNEKQERIGFINLAINRATSAFTAASRAANNTPLSNNDVLRAQINLNGLNELKATLTRFFDQRISTLGEEIKDLSNRQLNLKAKLSNAQ